MKSAQGVCSVKDRIILALDVPALDDAIDLVRSTKDFIGMYKVGMELFYSAGSDAVNAIVNEGVPVFLDLKLHDIPETVERTSRVLASMGVDMFNVHCMGGMRMMRAAAGAIESQPGEKRVKVLGVTMLTSLTEDEISRELGIRGTIHERVTALARQAKESGLDGVIASPHEIVAIKQACGDEFLVVTPGVRPVGAAADDQRRIMTPAQAIRNGADYIVIGRPITRSSHPRSAAQSLLSEIMRELEEFEC